MLVTVAHPQVWRRDGCGDGDGKCDGDNDGGAAGGGDVSVARWAPLDAPGRLRSTRAARGRRGRDNRGCK